MRNGNIEKLKLFVKNKNLFILPMRNGNDEEAATAWAVPITFYPTYEEWKQNKKEGRLKKMVYAFYPTYEEWKLVKSQALATKFNFLSYL